VVDGDELQVELFADLGDVAFVNNIELVSPDAMLTQFRLNQRQGQLGPIDWDVGATLEQVGHGSDVILVAVGEHQRLHLGQLLIVEVVQSWQQQVDAGMVVLGEEHPTVNEKDLPIDFVARHVASDISQAAEGNDAQNVRLQVRGCRQSSISHGVKPIGKLRQLRPDVS